MATIADIKERLLQEPDKIVEILEKYNFCQINHKPSEIRFARDDKGGQNISIRLQNNDFLNLNDYARSFRGDLFSFIIIERCVAFNELLQETRKSCIKTSRPHGS